MVRSSSDEVTVLSAPEHEIRQRADAPRQGHLIVLSGAHVGRVVPLTHASTVLGRDDSCELQLMDPGISRRHAEVVRTSDGCYKICDLGSRNGTYANNHRLADEHALTDGDRLQIGLVTILKFILSDSLEASYAQKMYDAALRDDLTGAFNRRYFDQRLQSEFSFSKRHGSPVALLFLDIDHFKGINDNHGHLAGDEVLKQLCRQVARIIRAEDVIVRYGGEEFAVVCRDTDLRQASTLAERIRHAVASLVITWDGRAVSLTISIGVVAAPDPAIDSPTAMIERADSALYEAKRRGRNCVVCHV